MKFIKYFFLVIGAILLIAIALLYASGNTHLFKAIQSTYLIGETGPSINDYTRFENRKVKTSSPLSWKESRQYNKHILSKEQSSLLEKWETVAFLVIKKDSILFEKYWDNYNNKSFSNSFSVAKSFVSIAIGSAIQEGFINSISDKASTYVKELKNTSLSEVTIKGLLTMSSGIDFGESYGDPFGFMAKAYYGENLFNLTIEKQKEVEEGKLWEYQGGNSLLLSFILKSATNMTLSDYFSKYVWQKVQAENDGLWTVNKQEGLEKAYCCFYSNARDFARIGKLYLDSGKWNNKPIVPIDYFIESISPVLTFNESGEKVDYYGFQWWLSNHKGESFFYARGILGQYIVVLPKSNIVLVRLGHKRDNTPNAKIPSDLIEYIDFVKTL